MIPGRTNRLVLEPTRTGVFRGVCAEYCGTSHALMSFYVVVLEQEDFAVWLAHQHAPAQPPTQPLAARGQELFLANGCGACHTVRGTPADGVVGPDLTHVGSRLSLGAGILPNDPEAFRRWIAHTEDVKPGVHMPAFGMLPPEDAAGAGSLSGRTRMSTTPRPRTAHPGPARGGPARPGRSGCCRRGRCRKAGATGRRSTTRKSASGTRRPPSSSSSSAACWRC